MATGLTDRTKAALVFYRQGATSLRFVAQSDLETWGVTAEDAWQAAHKAFGKLVARTKIEVLKAGDLSLGIVRAEDPFKASMILSPGLKALVPDELGWQVLAVAPARDFLYLPRKDGRRV